jgi:hypothetical protein
LYLRAGLSGYLSFPEFTVYHMLMIFKWVLVGNDLRNQSVLP